MTPIEIVAIVAMTGYAIYKQTKVSPVGRSDRFTLAVIYAVVGVVVGGFTLPHSAVGYGLLIGGLVLSAAVGLARGRTTTVWQDADGRVLRQGNVTTVALFVGLIVVKFAAGAFAYFHHIQDGAGFGGIMVMIAIMVAFQAEIVFRRGQRLAANRSNAVLV